MTVAVSGTETQAHLLSLYYLMLLVIWNVILAKEISMDCLFLHQNKIHISFLLIILWRYGVMCIKRMCNLLYVLWKLQTLLHVYESSIA